MPLEADTQVRSMRVGQDRTGLTLRDMNGNKLLLLAPIRGDKNRYEPITQQKNIKVPDSFPQRSMTITRSESVAVDCYQFESVQARMACFRSDPSRSV